MNQQPTIPISRTTLERLLAILTKGYQRQPIREVKQATDTIQHLLKQPTEEESHDPITLAV